MTRYESLVARRRISVTASATAVLSSRSEAFAVSSPVRSVTMVWKFQEGLQPTLADLGLVGLYAVYQAGLSSTLRRMTPGVIVPE